MTIALNAPVDSGKRHCQERVGLIGTQRPPGHVEVGPRANRLASHHRRRFRPRPYLTSYVGRCSVRVPSTRYQAARNGLLTRVRHVDAVNGGSHST